MGWPVCRWGVEVFFLDTLRLVFRWVAGEYPGVWSSCSRVLTHAGVAQPADAVILRSWSPLGPVAPPPRPID